MPEQSLQFKVARIHKLDSAGSMKAFVDMRINEQILIKGVKLIDGPKGLFVAMPQEKGKDNKWYDLIRCLTAETRMAITQEVLTAYKDN